MLFCSQKYLLFFTIIFALYWALPWHRARVWLLLTASLYFYASWNQWLALIIGATTVMDYLIARGLDATRSTLWRRGLLIFSLVVNLGLLGYFKYANFFLQSLEQSLHAAGLGVNMPLLKVILPIGISFYTFEAINYTVDVYRKKVPAEKNLANFMLFILFFPHLVAGPIVRARDFLPQVSRPKRFDWLRVQLGVQLFLVGLFKKMAVADRMALFADPVFADPSQYGTSAVWLATLAYAVQIYCDFSGYTDMAIGSAHLLGYKLAKNFNMPYLATSVADFWHRWHISLSTWLRDYLFIPLGGSRGGEWQTCRNLFITMTLGGLWHGASWNFVIWGVLHGLLLIGHRGFKSFCKPRPWLDGMLQSIPGTVGRWAVTFLTVSLCWVFFRASSWALAMTFFQRLFVPSIGLSAPLPNRSLWILVGVLALGHAVGASGLWRKWSPRLPAPVLGAGYALLLTLTLVLSVESDKAFIYFQF